MLDFFTRKYTNNDPGYVIRSLTYFEDAELQADPVTNDELTWSQVKTRVSQAVRELI